MNNPYLHSDIKPHQVDRNEIRLLCFNVYNIIAASASRNHSFSNEEGEPAPEFPGLDEMTFQMSEGELSKSLLRLALLVRTFDDTLSRSKETEEYSKYKAALEVDDFGFVFKGKENVTKSIRECCNKIIHAEDVRPVYATDVSSDDPAAVWGMTGELELEGSQAGKRWMLTLDVQSLLEGILLLIKFAENERGS